jgi:hypothetical protein
MTLLGAIKSLTCGPHMSVVPRVSDCMAPRMTPSDITDSQSPYHRRRSIFSLPSSSSSRTRRGADATQELQHPRRRHHPSDSGGLCRISRHPHPPPGPNPFDPDVSPPPPPPTRDPPPPGSGGAGAASASPPYLSSPPPAGETSQSSLFSRAQR